MAPVPRAESHQNAQAEEARSEPQDAKKSYRTILAQEIEEGGHELQRPRTGLFFSGLSAGLDIGFSVLLIGAMLTLLQGELPDPLVEILLGNAYAVGFVLVIFGRSELFTEHTTLAVLPVLARKASVLRLGRLWSIVFLANLIGTALSAAMIAFVGPRLHIVSADALGFMARRLLDHSTGTIFASGVLAGWLMGLLSWLVTAGRDTTSQLLFVWLVTFTIGFSRLHHCIVGSVEVLSAAFSGAGVGPGDYLRFLASATLGNAAGGVVFVAVLKYAHARRAGSLPPHPPHDGHRRQGA